MAARSESLDFWHFYVKICYIIMFLCKNKCFTNYFFIFPKYEIVEDANDEDVFISNFSEISYHLYDNIWLALGYGLNPLIINSITDEFYERGREEYLDNVGELPKYLEYYYGGFGEKIREAETMLMNENRLSIQAVIKF